MKLSNDELFSITLSSLVIVFCIAAVAVFIYRGGDETFWGIAIVAILLGLYMSRRMSAEGKKIKEEKATPQKTGARKVKKIG
ncbi:MAG: hypothetical protein ACP5MK_03280 [Candidatus Micrarchaeia archaeon]